MSSKNSKLNNKIHNNTKTGLSRYNSPKRKYKTRRNSSKSNKYKKFHSSKNIPKFPIFKKKLRQKLEEKEEIEFVLGDFKDFHKIEELQTFKNMTSLTLINESIKDISLIISNLPNPGNLYYLCLNQNEINSIDNIDKLFNLEELQINFNYLEKISKSVFNLKKLKKFWACENNISIIEYLPHNLQSLWLANNYIENIPDNFSKLMNLKELNLAGNFISSFQDLYLISEIKTLNRIYLSDINFGDNPICSFLNYRKIMIHIFNYVEIIDQIKVTFDEKYDVNRFYDANINKCDEKIKNNFRICSMIFRTMKTYFLFYSSFQLYKIKVLSLRLKFLEYNKINGRDDNYEIEDLENKIKKLLEQYNSMKIFYEKLKNNIKELNDSFIIYNSIKLETYDNIEIIPLLPNNKSSSFCINLMNSQLNEEFLKSNYYSGISFNEIYQIKNKNAKFIFNALYDDLIDENNKFGADTKCKKFLFIILPEKILKNKRKLFDFLTENEKGEKDLFFCDNFTYLDENEINYSKKNLKYKKYYNTTIICKCSFFESNVETIDARFNYFGSMEDIKNYLINLKRNSKKDVVCLKIKYDVNFYIYNNKGLILPKYIIKYNYTNSENSGFVSCYQTNEDYNLNIKFNSDKEKILNICSNHFFSKENENKIDRLIKKEKISKHQFTKFYEYNELDNSFFFLIKNSLINFFNKCFKYNDKEEYFNEIKILEEKIKEINECKNDDDNFLMKYDKYIKEEGKGDINIKKLKFINLFNKNITNIAFNDLLTKILKDLTKFKDISNMTMNCQVLSLSKNQLKEINLSKIFDLFPNLQKFDISHNNITSISFSSSEKENTNKFSSLNFFDISFNRISNLNTINKLKDILKCDEFLYYANPLETNKNKEKSKEIKKSNENINKKNLLFFEYKGYSFTNEINDFNDLKYFRTNKKKDFSRTYKNKILYLNNKNLSFIPKIDDINVNDNNEYNNADYNIIYLNSNKIVEIKNLTHLTNLYELYLQHNKIQLIAFFPLTLKKLDLSFNYISNLNEIEKNMNLEWINLDFNNISSITHLLELNRIKEIYCSNNLIESLSEDDYIKFNNLSFLEIIDFSRNRIIYSEENYRSKIIFNCSNLIKLNKKLVSEKEKKEANELYNGKVTIELLEKRIKEKSENNFSVDLNQLVELDLSGLNLKDENYIFDKKQYPNLKKLNISNNYFTTLEIFGLLPELSELNLNSNFFCELFPKKYCKNFKTRFNFSNLKLFDISNNKLSDIIGINNFTKLRKLNLKDNYILKIDSLDKLNDLNYLNISNNKLRSCDKANLGLLPSLKSLLCDNNYLKSINCFEKFASLEYLSFNANKITDIGCLDKLVQLKKLTKLSLINNPISHVENYRKIIILYFQRLKYLDNKEITPQERILFNNSNNNNNESILKSYSNVNMRSKRDEMVKLYDTFNESNKYQKMKSNIREASKNLDYFNIGYRLAPNPKSKKFLFDFDEIKSTKRSFGNNGSHMELNINILQSKNDKDFNRFLFLTKGKKLQRNIIPILKLSNTKKYDEVLLLNKHKCISKNRTKRPFSNNTRCNSNKTKPIVSKRNDYFSIVLNSFGNCDYTPLVTLKNFNIKKINF